MPKTSTYRFFYSEPAVKDLDDIIEYLNQYSTKSAETFVELLDNKINLLKSFPKIGTIPKIPGLKEQGYRILVLKYKYLLFYSVNDNEKLIRIERVLHGARDLSKLLLG